MKEKDVRFKIEIHNSENQHTVVHISLGSVWLLVLKNVVFKNIFFLLTFLFIFFFQNLYYNLESRFKFNV